jgi:hypothetical protein
MKRRTVPAIKRTIGAHVDEALWQTVRYQAEVDNVSVSALVADAVTCYLQIRGTQITTWEEILESKVK